VKRETFFDPGSLNHRMQLQSPVETSDGLGGVVISWASVVDVWANIAPYRNRSELLAQQQSETLTHKIVIRFRTDVASGWRFQLGLRNFQIITVHDPDERGRYLVCLAQEEGR